MSYHADLVSEIEAFCAEHGMSEITFGRLALRDPHFVRDIRGKRRLFRTTEDKVRAFMAEYSPADVVFPLGGTPDETLLSSSPTAPRAPASTGQARDMSTRAEAGVR